MEEIETRSFFINFQDHLAPKLDAYEQAIYLYLFRHSRFLGLDEAVVGLKSARARMAMGTGQAGSAMSESTVNNKIASLAAKGAIRIIGTDHKGRRIHLLLPNEIANLIVEPVVPTAVSIDEMDFFESVENRAKILKRENFKCFYTLKPIDLSNFVVEHVVSRPTGNNSYKNLVAASREANNRKGKQSAEDFLRRLWREGFLSEQEFEERLDALSRLKGGLLVPEI